MERMGTLAKIEILSVNYKGNFKEIRTQNKYTKSKTHSLTFYNFEAVILNKINLDFSLNFVKIRF